MKGMMCERGVQALLLGLAGVAATTGAIATQVPPLPLFPWEGPYIFWTNPPSVGGEIAHAALIGKPGALQGKVILWRTSTYPPPGQGIWIWDPAAPTSVSDADPSLVINENLFCAGQSFDGDGDLIIVGGNKQMLPCGTVEPNFSHTFNASQTYPATWAGAFGMLVSPTVAPYGHYYPSTLTLNTGKVISIGGGVSPNWDPIQCGGPRTINPADDVQIFNKPASTWQTTTTNPTDPTVAGLNQGGLGPAVHFLLLSVRAPGVGWPRCVLDGILRWNQAGRMRLRPVGVV